MKVIPSPVRRQHGMAVIVVMAILSLLLIYLMGNVRTLHYLGRDLKQIEQSQLHRLQHAVQQTNLVANPTPPSEPPTPAKPDK